MYISLLAILAGRNFIEADGEIFTLQSMSLVRYHSLFSVQSVSFFFITRLIFVWSHCKRCNSLQA